MAVTVEDAWEGPSGDGESRELRYLAHDPDGINDIAARAAVLLAAPPEHAGLKIDEKRVRVEQISATLYLGIVPYTAYEKGDGFTISFDTTGGTTTIKQSIETVESTRFMDDPPDFGGAINVGPTGEVDGVDIVEPRLTFAFSRKVPLSDISNPAWLKTLAMMTGTTNDAEWRGYAEGEVLFLGAVGSQAGPGEDIDVTFSFAASQNIDELIVIPLADPVMKKGWEYLWCKYAPHDSHGVTAHKPIAAYVEKVYHASDFTWLGFDD